MKLLNVKTIGDLYDYLIETEVLEKSTNPLEVPKIKESVIMTDADTLRQLYIEGIENVDDEEEPNLIIDENDPDNNNPYHTIHAFDSWDSPITVNKVEDKFLRNCYEIVTKDDCRYRFFLNYVKWNIEA